MLMSNDKSACSIPKSKFRYVSQSKLSHVHEQISFYSKWHHPQFTYIYILIYYSMALVQTVSIFFVHLVLYTFYMYLAQTVFTYIIISRYFTRAYKPYCAMTWINMFKRIFYKTFIISQLGIGQILINSECRYYLETLKLVYEKTIN